MAARDEVVIQLMAKNMATSELDRASNSLMQMGSAVEKSSFLAQSASQVWMGAMMRIGDAITNFFAKGMALVTDSIIGFNARQEQALIGFTTMLGSAQEAQGFMEELQDFAAATPFEFDGLRQSANLIMAMGFEAKEVIPLLTAAGDAVAALGLGTEAVQRVVYALGQMKAAGRVTGQDMMQLASMGIPAWKMLADAVGMTVQETKKAAEQGLIDADTAIKGITEAIESGNMGGMMAAQARTFNGAMSTIKDTVQIVVASAFKPLFDEVSGLALAVADFLGSADFLSWAEEVGQGIGDLLGEFVELGEGLWEIAQDILPSLFDTLGSVVDVGLRGIRLLISALDGVFTVLGGIAPLLTTILPIVLNMAIAMKAVSIATGLWAAAQAALNSAVVLTTWTKFIWVIQALAPASLFAAGGVTALGTAIKVALGPIGWITIAVGAAVAIFTQLVDVGKLIDNFAMDFGDMGETIHAVADSTGRDYDAIKTSIAELRDEFEFSFEEATVIVQRFGEDAEEMGDDVKRVMEGLDVSVEDSIGIIQGLGEGWRRETDDIIAAVEASGVSWNQAYDHLYTLNAGMKDSVEITQMLSDAAAESPEAWAELVAGVEPASEEFQRLTEQMHLTTEALDTAGYDWVESVKRTTDGIRVTLTDGTEIVGKSADEVMGQVTDRAEQMRADTIDKAQAMIDGMTSLFESETELTDAWQELIDRMDDPYTEAERKANLFSQATIDNIHLAITSGDPLIAADSQALVNRMLAEFALIEPGALESGEAVPPALRDGMDSQMQALVDYIEAQTGTVIEGLTLEEAEDLGVDGIWKYMQGIKAQERQVEEAGKAQARAAIRGAGGLQFGPTGRSQMLDYSSGINNPSTRTALQLAGEGVGKAAKAGVININNNARAWGIALARAYAGGLESDEATGLATSAGFRLAAAASTGLSATSPPKAGPLHFIDRDGYMVGKTWADGLSSSARYVESASMEVAGAALGGFSISPGASAFGVGGGEAALFGEGGNAAGGVTIVNHFGAGSVRSDDDVYAISRQIAQQVRMETV